MGIAGNGETLCKDGAGIFLPKSLIAGSLSGTGEGDIAAGEWDNTQNHWQYAPKSTPKTNHTQPAIG